MFSKINLFLLAMAMLVLTSCGTMVTGNPSVPASVNINADVTVLGVVTLTVNAKDQAVLDSNLSKVDSTIRGNSIRMMMLSKALQQYGQAQDVVDINVTKMTKGLFNKQFTVYTGLAVRYK